MNDAPRLYELQLIDLEVDEKGARLAQLESCLGETEELQQARQDMQSAQATAAEMSTRSLDLELQIGTLDAEVKDIEGRLYGGSIRSPRELATLEQDLKAHRNHRSKLEDQQLELMDNLDASRSVAREKEKTYALMETTWRDEQQAFREEIDQINTRLGELHTRRQSLAAGFDSSILATYEELRRTKRGRAVAKVEQNTCTGCRITLPSQEVQRARLNPRLSFCSNCGRILWASR